MIIILIHHKHIYTHTDVDWLKIDLIISLGQFFITIKTVKVTTTTTKKNYRNELHACMHVPDTDSRKKNEWGKFRPKLNRKGFPISIWKRKETGGREGGGGE